MDRGDKIQLGRKQLTKFQQKKRTSFQNERPENQIDDEINNTDIKFTESTNGVVRSLNELHDLHKTPNMEGETNAVLPEKFSETPGISTPDKGPVSILPSSPHLAPALSPDSGRIEYLERLTSTLYKENRSLISTIQKLQSEIALSENEKTALQRHVTATELKLKSDYNNEVSNVSKKLKSELEKNASLHKQLMQLQHGEKNELLLIKNDLVQSRDDLAKSNAINGDLERENESLHQELREERSLNEELGLQQQVLRAQIDELTFAKKEREEFREANSKLQERVQHLESEAFTRINESQVESLEISLNEQLEINQNLQSKISDEQERFNEASRNFSREKAEYETQLQDFRAKSEQIATQNQELLKELKMSQVDSNLLISLKKENLTIREQFAAASERIKVKESTAELSSRRIIELENSQLDLRKELEKHLETISCQEKLINSERTGFEAKITDLMQENSNLKTARVQLESELQSSQNHYYNSIMKAIARGMENAERSLIDKTSTLCSDDLLDQISAWSNDLNRFQCQVGEATEILDKALAGLETIEPGGYTQDLCAKIRRILLAWESQIQDLKSKNVGLQDQVDRSAGNYVAIKDRLLSAAKILQSESLFVQYDFSSWSEDELSAILAIILTGCQKHYADQASRFEIKVDSLENSLANLRKTENGMRHSLATAVKSGEEINSRCKALEEQLSCMKQALTDTTDRWKHACAVVTEKSAAIESLNEQLENLKQQLRTAEASQLSHQKVELKARGQIQKLESRCAELEEAIDQERKNASESMATFEQLLENERLRAVNLKNALKSVQEIAGGNFRQSDSDAAGYKELVESLQQENFALRRKSEEIAESLNSMKLTIQELKNEVEAKDIALMEKLKENHTDLERARETINLLNDELIERNSLLADVRLQRENYKTELELYKKRTYDIEPDTNVSPIFDLKLESTLARAGETVKIIDQLVQATSTGSYKKNSPDAIIRFCISELEFAFEVLHRRANEHDLSIRLSIAAKTARDLRDLWVSTSNLKVNLESRDSSFINPQIHQGDEMEIQDTRINQLYQLWRHELKINEVLVGFLEKSRQSCIERLNPSADKCEIFSSKEAIEQEIEKLKSQHKYDKKLLLERFKQKMLALKSENEGLSAELMRLKTETTSRQLQGTNQDVFESSIRPSVSHIEKFLYKERERHRRHCKILVEEIAVLRKKYRRVSGYRADLIYQKNYLLLLLDGAKAM